MEWLNLHTSILDSEQFLCSEPLDQSTWLKMLRYCMSVENGGMILNCKQWNDRKWTQLVRVTMDNVLRPCDLWKWDGEDLVVMFYPVAQEELVQSKRDGGKKGSAKRWNKPQAPPPAQPKGVPLGVPLSESMRNGKEGKEKEWNGASDPVLLEFPAREIPTWEQVVDFCNGPAGVQEDVATRFYEYYSNVVSPPWTAGGLPFQWKGKLVAWGVRDREEAVAEDIDKNGVDKDQLMADLAREPDAKKRAEIRKKL